MGRPPREGSHGNPNSTARIHHAALRRTSCVAACGRRAAVGDAGDRVPLCRVPRSGRASRGVIPPRSCWNRLCRRSERHHPIPLGIRPLRTVTCVGHRACASARERHRHDWRRTNRPSGQECDIDHSHRVLRWRRSSQDRPCCKPEPTRRQRYRCEPICRRASGGLLHELVPRANAIGVLMNPNFPPAEQQLRDAQAAARAMGLQIYVMRASTDVEIDAAFEAVAQQRISALTVTGDPFFATQREKLAALAARYAVPAMYHFRHYVVAGGLMSYGTILSDAYRNVGVYTGKVLSGAKPVDLPVMQLSNFELVLNLKTAKALGLTFPPGLLAIADEVIE